VGVELAYAVGLKVWDRNAIIAPQMHRFVCINEGEFTLLDSISAVSSRPLFVSLYP
jgi:hypothetical protein